ncbi:sugar phosphate isomerase/epimerase family protein [Paenibacillus aestuarii]|uniref:Sugar phosphate isomerase/epimerase family protein n=1 Tax=Paenibacillus aestuarii TaxID=516965 RepID=A0ABW0K5A3_9BACL|nr:sugar phosphate isomerase/epimerase family protein [Paenibacillus aestuarii]
MRLGLSVYGTMFSMGIVQASERSPIRPLALIDKALELGLEGVEIPIELLEHEDVMAVARYARERDMFIGLETVGFDPAHLTEALELAARMSVPTLRTIVMGAKFGGDRRPLTGRWKPFLNDILHGLQGAVKAAERLGVNLAVENHQDLASEELLWLCKTIGSEKFGIILDTGNTLATAEEPIQFARTVAPYLKHVHLKDYKLYLSEEGFRLVRCPLGQGVVDFPQLFSMFSETCPDITMTVEIGALESRHVRLLADDYWPEYPPRSAAQLAKVMHFVFNRAEPPGDWRTPYECGEHAEAIIAYESSQLETSIAYIRKALGNV